jgi:hypothetical protein
MAVETILSIYTQLVEHLARTATPEEILAFKVSEEAQQRADELLERNNEGELTSSEVVELQQMLEFERMMSVLKAKALLALKQRA